MIFSKSYWLLAFRKAVGSITDHRIVVAVAVFFVLRANTSELYE